MTIMDCRTRAYMGNCPALILLEQFVLDYFLSAFRESVPAAFKLAFCHTKAESRVSGCVQRGCMITCPAPYSLHKCYHGVTVLRSIKSEKSNAVSTPNIDKAAKKQYNMRNYISSSLKNFKIFVT